MHQKSFSNHTVVSNRIERSKLTTVANRTIYRCHNYEQCRHSGIKGPLSNWLGRSLWQCKQVVIDILTFRLCSAWVAASNMHKLTFQIAYFLMRALYLPLCSILASDLKLLDLPVKLGFLDQHWFMSHQRSPHVLFWFEWSECPPSKKKKKKKSHKTLGRYETVSFCSTHAV